MVHEISWLLFIVSVVFVKIPRSCCEPTGPNVCQKSQVCWKINLNPRGPDRQPFSWRLARECEMFIRDRVSLVSCCEGYGMNKHKKCQPICTQECIYGKCVKPDKCQCFDGWRGDDCSSACPKGKWGVGCVSNCLCQNEAYCDPITGNCTCMKGWRGDFCEEPCPGGQYGHACEEECKCQNNATCNHVHGRCNCTAGYQGPLCAEKCPEDSHGYECSEECKCQNNGTCHHEDGSCSCTSGWTGPICTEKCDEGYFGISCLDRCNCYNGASCNVFTGQCKCTAGLYGEHCELECSQDTWGQSCSQRCNCTKGECNSIDGSCICDPGYIGKTCQERACQSKLWGPNCSNVCNCQYGADCHPATGECWCSPLLKNDCSLGMKGTSERLVAREEQTEGANNWFIAFLISTLVMNMLLITLGVMYYKKCIQLRAKEEGQSLLPSYAELAREER